MSLQLPATGRERESGKESQGRVARNPGIQERKEGKNEGWKQGCKEGRKNASKEARILLIKGRLKKGSKDAWNAEGRELYTANPAKG